MNENIEKTELSVEERAISAEPEEQPLTPPRFVINTVINAEVQHEVSKAVMPKSSKIMTIACFVMLAAAMVFLVYQYAAKGIGSPMMIGLVGLAFVYLVYNQLTMPKKALKRWEEQMIKTYGSPELHLTTEFYDLTLAQTNHEDGSVLVSGYSELLEMCECEHLILLRHGARQYFFLAKDGFQTGTLEDFRTFLAGQIGGK